MVAAEALPGFVLSHAISARVSLAGKSLRPMIQSGPVESIAIGSKSFR
jgi:hypothetical protein